MMRWRTLTLKYLGSNDFFATSWMCCFSITSGGLTEFSAEDDVHVFGMLKAAHAGDSIHREIGVSEKLLSAFDLDDANLLLW